MPAAPNPHQRLPRYMTQSELRAFFGAITRRRDQALFGLIYQYGLRVSEVSLLKREDVNLESARIVIRRVKGGLWTERPLFSSTQRLLEGFDGLQSGRGLEALFPGRNGPLRKRQIQSLFVHYRESAGLDERYTCHSLRHSIATHLLDAGLPLEFVQDHLGHRNIRSTTVYAQITNRHRVAVFRQLESSPWIVNPFQEAKEESS